MPRIRALTSWAGRNAGDEWDESETNARMLCAPDLPGGQKAEYVDRAMTAIDLPGTAPRFDQPAEKRRYMRRDLRAQD